MSKKITSLFIALIGAAMLLSACSSTKVETPPTDEKKIVVPPTEGLDKCSTSVDAGKLMIKSVIEGLTQQKYDLYSRDFTEQNKKYFNDKVFNEASEAVKNELGEFKSDNFVGFWVKGNYTIVLWKARFSKTKDDILIEMYISKDDKGYKIAAVKVI